MTFITGGRACGKTTFLQQEALAAFESGEHVQVIVANAQRANSWVKWMQRLSDNVTALEAGGTIDIITVSELDRLRGVKGRRFVDDAEEVLAQILGYYDLAVATGGFFAPPVTPHD